MSKGFIEAYSTDVAVLTNNAIPFNINKLTKGCAVKQTSPFSFALNECGLYRVLVSVSGAVTTTAGNIVVELMKDGVLQADSIQQAYSGTALTDDVNIVLDTFVQSVKNNTNCCCDSPTNIQIVLNSESEDATFENTHITIEKVCG